MNDFIDEGKRPIFGVEQDPLLRQQESNRPREVGIHIDWSLADKLADKWAQDFFGDDAPHGSMTRDEECLSVELLWNETKGIPDGAYETYKRIFDKYDLEGDYDPYDEFPDGKDCFCSELPETISSRIIADMVKAGLGFKPAYSMAAYSGVFLFEKRFDASSYI